MEAEAKVEAGFVEVCGLRKELAGLQSELKGVRSELDDAKEVIAIKLQGESSQVQDLTKQL